jgi:hypothetical protein
MRKIVLAVQVLLLFLTATAMLCAAEEPNAVMTLNGMVIDQACAESHKDDLSNYIKTHTKECALKPENQKRGYVLLTPDNEVTPFTPKSNAKIIAFLKSSKNSLRVTVKAKLANEQLELLSIANIVKVKGKKEAEPVKK